MKGKGSAKRSVWTYLSSKDTFFATLWVFALMYLLHSIPVNTHFLDPLKLALRDFNYNDLAYSKLGKNNASQTDDEIVVVNIGNADRENIALMIDKVMEAAPKVAGVDVLFKVAKDKKADTMLFNRFKNYPNLVMAYNLEHQEDGFKPYGYFYQAARHKGFANFVGEEEGVIRYIKPEVKEGKEGYDSFAGAILKIAHPEAYQAMVSRDNAYEVINYKRTADKYNVIEGAELLAGNEDPALLKGKIVLLGYVSLLATDIEDKHYTPCNTVLTGRGTPDMNGVFIHSNVIGMAIDDDFVAQTPAWLNWLIAFVFCYVHMALFIKYYLESHLWFHLKAKIMQLVMAVLFVYLGLWAFTQLTIQINMTATLVAVILAVDVLYFYHSFAMAIHKKYNYPTIFSHDQH